MRIAIVAVVCLVIGALCGTLIARQEFAYEVLPIDGPLATPGSTAAAHDAGGPRLKVLSPERYNFGVMDQSAKMTHVFEIQNDGDAPLTVDLDGTSCKCTAAGLNKNQLAPGETAEITMEWNAKSARAHEPFEQYAEYRTNDLRRPRFRLLVFGEVRPTLFAEPREAIFNRVSSQEPARATVKIYGAGSEQLQVISHKLTHAKSTPFFSLQFEPLDPAEFPPNFDYKSGLAMHVNLKPGLPLGQLAQNIQITTNLNPEATFDIPVYGSIVSDISLVGPRTVPEDMLVDLGSFSSRQGAKSVVYLVVKGQHRDQTKLTLASVVPAAELTATLGEPLRNNAQLVSYPLTLDVLPGATPVSRMSAGSQIAVRIETTHPQVKELTIYVKYAVVD